MPGPVPHALPLPAAAIARLVTSSAAVNQLTPREAELCDMLATANLEPRLTAAAPTLRLVAATRPGRQSIGG